MKKKAVAEIHSQPHLYLPHVPEVEMCLQLKAVPGRCMKSVDSSCPKTPASLKRLEGFLQAEEHEVRFEAWGFLGYDSSFAFLCGKSTVVDIWVQLLELKRSKEMFIV